MDINYLIDRLNSQDGDEMIATIEMLKEHYREYFSNIDKVVGDRRIALSLSLLTRKDKIARYALSDEHIMQLLDWLSSCDDAKVRKNVYSTLGNLNVPIERLYALIDRENSYMNIYHLVGIMVHRDDVDRDILLHILDKIDKDNAYYSRTKALIDAKAQRERHYLVRLQDGDRLLLTNEGTTLKVLSSDIKNISGGNVTISKHGVLVSSPFDLSDLLSVRSYDEALILPSGASEVYHDIDAFTRFISGMDVREYICNILDITLSELSFRVEVRGENISSSTRTKFASKVARAIAHDGLINIRNNYDFELRIYVDNDGVRAYFAVPIRDERFAYRKGSLPASINPATASVIAEYVMRYAGCADRVLDGFVGSGTMLMELYMRHGDGEYVGVDIDARAIEIAKGNIGDKIPMLTLVKSNILTYNGGKFDIVVSNLPFGTRVMRHDSTVALYNKFLLHLPDLLVDGGRAFLLTTNGKALRGAVAQTQYHIIKEIRLVSGGLMPYLFVIGE